MAPSSPDQLTAGDRVGLCLDIDGTVHPHGSIFVEALALVPYASDLPIDRSERDTLRDVLGTVAAYAGGDRARRRWLTVLRACDALARVGLGRVAARVLTRLIRYRARRASGAGSTSERGDYRAMQRRILDGYGRFLAGRHHDRVERAFEQVVGTHLRVESSIRRTLAELGGTVDLDVVLVTDVPTHIARPYGGLLGRVDVVGTDFATTDGRFTGEYAFVEKGTAVETLHAERGWEYTIAAGDSANDLPMAAAADLFLAVAGRGTVVDDLPAAYGTVTAPAVRRDGLADETDAVLVDRDTTLGDALRSTLAALGVESDRLGDSSPSATEG